MMMKCKLSHVRAITLGALSCFTTLHAQTEDSNPPTPEQSLSQSKHIRVQVEFIEVSHEQFTQLLFEQKPPVHDSELRNQVAKLIKEGKASIMETLLCTSTSGQKASTESVEEFIYPTEYEPATIPGVTDQTEKKATDATTNKDVSQAIGPQPSAFEPRNLGSTLEIEPMLGPDQKSIFLRFSPEIVCHVGTQVWAEWKGPNGGPVQMPIFYRLAAANTVRLTDGQYMLSSSLTPKNKEGHPDPSRKLMVFVKADVITSGP